MHKQQVLLEIEKVRKVFPGVVAVDDVSFSIRKGEVHVIIGENGAGKSTLVKMMAGLYPIDGGRMLLDGEEYRPANVLEAQKKGVCIIHQELSMMLNRTVAQNVYVGREPVKKVGGMVDTKKMDQDCRELLDSLGIDLRPDMLVKDLSIAQQQMVEVAKAISMKNRLLIMDEPTSSLTQKEIDALFTITRRLRSEGVAIIYISHRMQELMEIGDRVTVMRDGAYIGTRDASDLEMSELITMMVGRKIENIYDRIYRQPGEIVLRTEKLTGLRFRDVSIEIKEGEIVGLGGLVGAGRTELAKAIFGYDKILGGKLWFDGKEVDVKRHTCSRAVKLGMSLLPEDRKAEGLFLPLSIEDNIVLSALSYLFPRGKIRKRVIEEEGQKGVAELKIATTSAKKRVVELSGGNQQKVVIAKWLIQKSRLFIFDEPTRGIDVGAKAEIYSLMDDLAAGGAAVLMISSDLPELMGLSDRIYTMKDGEISGQISHLDGDYDQETVLGMAIGGERDG